MYEYCYSSLGIICTRIMKRKSIVLLLVIMPSLFYSVDIRHLGNSVITTKYGDLRGLLVNFEDRSLTDVEIYRGLRFGNIRSSNEKFANSDTSFGNWNQTQIANKFTKACPQRGLDLKKLLTLFPKFVVIQMYHRSNFTTQNGEDCLSLNLFLPSREWTDTTPFAVMVFVHGESYEIGTGNAYDGSVLASYGNVIVITLNYRLGVLGFLNTGHTSAAGNQALMDLMAVLHWIQDNIGSFNGDPKRVTLFGHGHGAALVNILMFSPLTEKGKYFHGAILQSGSALSSWAVSYDARSCAQWLARNVNCSNYNDTDSLTKCLKSRGAQELVNNSPIAPKYKSCMAPSPNGFGHIFPDKIENLMISGSNTFTSIPVMFGVTSNEAYSYFKQRDLNSGISKRRKSQILRTFVMNNYKYNRQKIYEILDHEYSSWDTSQNDFTRLENILQLLSDGLYVAPLVQMARQHSLNAKSYLYAFTHATRDDMMQYHNWTRAVHGDDLPYVFGAPLVNGISPFSNKFTKSEKILSESMMRYWTNFAKTGNPNLPGEGEEGRFEQQLRPDPVWTTYDKQRQNYLHFGSNSTPSHHYRGKKLSLWLDLIPKLNSFDLESGQTEPDPSDELSDVNDMSSFDDPHLLITKFKKIFPSEPPIPPIPPPFGKGGYKNRPVITDPFTGKAIQGNNQKGSKKEREIPSIKEDPKPVTKREKETNLSNSVPLSITVAIGCSLLFINILLFSAVYYQRRRIQRLNRETAELERNEQNNFPACGIKVDIDDTDAKEPPDRNTKPSNDLDDRPNIQSNPLYSVINKNSSDSAPESSRESLSTVSCASSGVQQKNVINNKSGITPSLPKDVPRTDNKPTKKDSTLVEKNIKPILQNNAKGNNPPEKLNHIRQAATHDTITVV